MYFIDIKSSVIYVLEEMNLLLILSQNLKSVMISLSGFNKSTLFGLSLLDFQLEIMKLES